MSEIKEFSTCNFAEYGHGANAEANAAEYIKHATRHKLGPEDGIVLPELFSLNESAPYFVSEYVGKERQAKRKFDFSALGLQYTDFTLNQSDGTIVRDLGEIVPLKTPSAIVGNPIGTKISKQFSQLTTLDERLKFLSDLRDKALKEKNLLKRTSTLNAINEIVGTRLTILG